MMNPIRNIERMVGPGGPERALNLPTQGGSHSFSAGRHEPHNYPVHRMTVVHVGMPKEAALPKTKTLAKTGLFGMQEGGEVDSETDTPDAGDLKDSPDNLSPRDAQMQQVVIEAMAALRGENPDAKRAIQRFIDLFGEDQFRELRQMVLAQPKGDEEEGDPNESEPDQDEDDAPPPQPQPTPPPAAGGMQVGGLLRGPGSGQSDEIEAATPGGRRVLLSDGEYVIDAPTVAVLGDGSTDAGARRLDAFRKEVRRQAYGHDKQAKAMKKGGKLALLQALNQ
jgi:hypothetical protein